MLFDKVIAFDNFRQKIILIVNIRLDELETEYNRALMELDQMKNLVENGTPKMGITGRLRSEITPLFNEEQ